MQLFLNLWLCIIASAGAVWVASALGWMLIGHHRHDWEGLPNEEASLDVLRSLNLKPGCYGFPYCRSHRESASKEFIARWERGPAGILRI